MHDHCMSGSATFAAASSLRVSTRAHRNVDVEHQHGKIGRTNAADAAGLAEAAGADAAKLFAGLVTKLGDGSVIEMHWDRFRFQALEALYLDRLAVDIAGVLCLDGNLASHISREGSQLGAPRE